MALALAAEGSTVVCSDINEQTAQAAAARVEEIGAKGVANALDTADEEAVKEALIKTQRDLGRLDVLMNNAGVAGKDWDTTTAINFSGVYYGLMHACPLMAEQGGGAVVNTASVAGLGALMRQRVVYVMTHDSIGLGEDGPTHQPVEHLAALRAIPNLLVFRPGDAVETAEAWQCALAAEESPSILALSRQGLEQFRLGDLSENMTARGAYIAAGEADERQVTLMASGSEVGIAISAHEMLAADSIAATVVSVPCMELFRQQDAAWQKMVLGTAPRIAIEAAIRQPWDRILGENDAFVGMDDFGASAPAGDLFPHFGITADAVVAAAKTRVA